MNTPVKVALVFAAVTLHIACQRPELPLVAKQSPQLTDDDREVMRAVLDHTLRPIRDRLHHRGPSNLAASTSPIKLFLVFDSTIEVCPSDPAAYSRRIIGCVGKDWLTHLEHLGLGSDRRAEALFRTRNSQVLPVSGILVDDVVYIPSATVGTPTRLGDFIRQYPPGSALAVVVFSAPVYPTARSAVIFYHHLWSGGGFIHLARVGTTWSPVKTSAWVE
jgi:hypothetical protein